MSGLVIAQGFIVCVCLETQGGEGEEEKSLWGAENSDGVCVFVLYACMCMTVCVYVCRLETGGGVVGVNH